MKLTITSITLRTPFHFFPLSFYALSILKQLNATNAVGFKKTGLWTTHYTMTLWETEADLKAFAMSGAHLEAMKKGAKIAKSINTLTIDATELLDWKEAKALLEKNGRVVNY